MPIVISGTNGISGVDGTASSPALEGTDANTGVFFPAADTVAIATGGTQRLTVNSSGNTQTVGTISVGNATPSTSGAGITFPATQSASSDANTLDDYEEGTWTPSLSSTGASFTYPRGQYGMYVKVGQLVFAQFYIGASATGTTSNSCSISGLPFTVNNLNALAQSSVAAWVDQTTSLGFTTDTNGATITIWRQNVGGASAATAAQVAGGYIVGHVMYRAGS
jgi:hypothetical protein